MTIRKGYLSSISSEDTAVGIIIKFSNLITKLSSLHTMSEMDQDEDWDIVKLDENRVGQLWKQVLGDISHQSAAKQVGVGTVSGIFSGWLFVKVGKLAAVSLGTSILLIQIAQHQGYIQINWDLVQSRMRVAQSSAKKAANRHCPGFVRSCKMFVQKNIFLALGFGGGFLIGLTI